ncbi:MAG: putative lipid II flippase FtsW [bacterium]
MKKKEIYSKSILKNILKDKGRPDFVLVGIAGVLILFGILILASVSAPFAQEKTGESYYFLRHQFLFGLIPGLILGFLAFKINLSFLKRQAPVLLLTNLILMIMVFLPVIGSKSASAARWLNFGFFSFQPSEFLKLTFILYLAIWLANKKESRQTFVAFLAVLGAVILLLFFQSDISTLGVILTVAGLMYFSSNTPLWQIASMGFIGIGVLFSLIKLAPYRVNRFLVFLNPDLDPMGIGYQVRQALIAVGSGGIMGVGLGMSAQKLGFLPQTISDSIFAVFSEETGFIGGFFLIFLFLLFLWRGFKIAKESQDKFSQLAALGITSWIVLQTFVNIGAMIGILPLTGIPLPFISYGGSAMIAELIGLGILLNISKQ